MVTRGNIFHIILYNIVYAFVGLHKKFQYIKF